jgi:hypothetical protein
MAASQNFISKRANCGSTPSYSRPLLTKNVWPLSLQLVTGWGAEGHGEKGLADLFERRIMPEFRPVFEAWKKTDPLRNRNAPAGPQLMPEFRSSKMEEASRLGDESSALFEQGTSARHVSDKYVRLTVILATVLLLTAIGQRFKNQVVRLGLLVISVMLLSFSLYRIFELPRL